MNQTQDLPVSSSGRDLQKSNRVMLGVVTEAKATRPGFVEVSFLFSFHSPLAPLLSLILIIKGVEILEKNRDVPTGERQRLSKLNTLSGQYI